MTVEWRPAWLRYQLDKLRGRANDALTELDRKGRMPAYLARFLRHLLDAVSTEQGVVWCGALELAKRLHLTERRIRQLIAEALRARWIQQIHWSRGGKHRTSRFALKFGDWRDDARDPQMYRHFDDRKRIGNEQAEDWLNATFAAHLDRGLSCCWIFAPRDMKPPPVKWVLV